MPATKSIYTFTAAKFAFFLFAGLAIALSTSSHPAPAREPAHLGLFTLHPVSPELANNGLTANRFLAVSQTGARSSTIDFAVRRNLPPSAR
jgi:hypothetical protein